MSIYNLIEVANVHGGSTDYLRSLLEEFRVLTGNFGIKFQVFKYDEIAMEDYAWYSDYKKLFISEKEWKELIGIAGQTKDVWIDMSDTYSLKILEQNLPLIHGLKFQASVLNNHCLLKELSLRDLSKIKIMINISAYSLDQIGNAVERISALLSPHEIILQVGFQDYPTKLADSGLPKIGILKEIFSHRISFADHVEAISDEAIYLPVAAVMMGASIIEKHVKHSKLETIYDCYSSIPIDKYKKYLEVQNQFLEAMDQAFINERETIYLKKSLQTPVTNKSVKNGQPISLYDDLDFKRTNKNGLDFFEIEQLTRDLHILSRNKKSREVFKKEDFKKAVIATIIACRLKSSRLPQKALLKIGDLSSIELCIKNTLKFKNVNHTVLATSTLDEDLALKDYTYSESVVFHRGDPEDVIQRYMDIIERLKIDIFIRVTGDMPFVSDKILQILLKSHFANGADYTIAKKAAVGTNLEIINAAALKRIRSYFHSTEYSEYMSFYFTNNPSYFRLNFVELPDNLVRDYRLTLDYAEDLTMFNHISDFLKMQNIEYDIEALFEFLDNNPEIADMNKKCTLVYQTDISLIKLLNDKTKIKS